MLLRFKSVKDIARRQSLALAVVLWSLVCVAEAQVKPARRVLVFYEIGLSSPSVSVLDREIRAALEKSPFQIELYREYLETTLFPDPRAQKEIRDWYIQKYRTLRPDVVIAIGPSPIRFLVDSHEKSFKDVPVVFGGLSGVQPENLHLSSDFTGVWDVVEPTKTLEIALKLKPNTRHVVVVGGQDAFDLELEAWFHKSLRRYESKLEFTYLTDLSMPELVERISHLQANTIVLLTHIGQDAAGTPFVGASQADPLIARAANAPVFGPSDVDIGHGEVGGYLDSFALQGQIMGNMATRILQGDKPQQIPVVTGADVYMFDWQALRRWGMNEHDLPPGSTLLNRQPTAWESYKWYIVACISLMLIEGMLIAGLLWQRARRRILENELEIAHDRLRLAFQAGRSVGWDWDPKSGRNEWFGDLQTLFGIPADRYSAQLGEFRQRVYPEDRDLVWQVMTTAKDKREPYVAEFRVTRKDGTIRWVTAAGKFYYQNGSEARMLGVAIDITDRKLAEEARFRHAVILESTDDAIISEALDGTIISWNTGAHRIFGYTEAEIVGQPIFVLIPLELQDEERKILETLRAGGRIEHYETTRATKTGETVCVSLTISPIKDSAGRLVGLSKIARDITQSKRAEDRLRETNRALQEQTAKLQTREELLTSFVKNVPAGVAMLDRDMRYLQVSDRWCTDYGLDPSRILGRSHYEVLPDMPAQWREVHRRALNGETLRADEERWERKGGTIWVRWEVRPWLTLDWETGGILIFAEEITRRKQADEALASVSRRLIESQEQERSRIARELHDDISQQLALVAVELDHLDRSGSHNKFQESKERVMAIAAAVQRLSHKLHSSKLEYLGLATAAKSFCKEFSEAHNVQIDFTQNGVPRELRPEVSLCLFRVLQEALQNAVKYSGVNHFDVRLCGTSTDIRLTVKDFGRGFEVDDAIKTHGLGLVSMRERVNLVNGEIVIESQPTAGTEIKVHVPLRVANRSSEVTSGAA